ncbi:SDR family NAD(P)-dependent oxidoreductase [Sulfurovum mangrovi]|uniref:SDR family NAD(P)-dependent oxidoreductase n=1 Tax=Sulfurovum mangrovi TaxID=2893889 RepID=UPI001E64026C|nr:SDR family NAD(P)-dependent oxidoreductase [Sulfurovum mangrovi]UFH60488.1 SDR family NAD(P)-dependent oxidoreductase [Sulfurovum mangrovi]
MAKIFITGSSDGLGLLAAKMLMEQGHEVILHARNTERAKDAKMLLPEAKCVLIADLSDMEETKQLAEELNALGPCDAIIHNAGVYQADRPTIFAVNVLAPYILTAMITRPQRLIYIGSNMHPQGSVVTNALSLETGVSYSDSKLQVLTLAKAVARKWPGIYVNTVDPGWVPTKMGGSAARDDLDEGAGTQVWLASSEDALCSGRYLFHRREVPYDSRADDEDLQEQLIARCEEISGIKLPAY